MLFRWPVLLVFCLSAAFVGNVARSAVVSTTIRGTTSARFDSLDDTDVDNANAVLSTLQYFPEEYAAHVGTKKHCPSLKCKALIRYDINEKCTGCTLCAKRCPVSCISGKRREIHIIEQDACIQCGVCFEVCRFDAVTRA